MRLNSGFTLIELLVTMAISSFLVVVTLATSFTSIQASQAAIARLDSTVDLLLLSDYFSKQIPNAGGQGLPLNAALFVENNCAMRGVFPGCVNSDRITLLQANSTPACSITSNGPSFGTYYVTKTATTCCLSSQTLTDTQVVLVQNGSFGQRHVTSQDTGKCMISLEPGPAAINDTVTPDTSTSPHNWSTAAVYPVIIDTYYLDTVNSLLMDYNFTKGVGVPMIVADRVFDLQFSLGFDFNPQDGVAYDDGTTTDEWLYNATGEALGAGVFKTVTTSSMRMVGLGLIVGAPVPNSVRTGAQVLDGPSRNKPNWVLRSELVKLALRSTYIFQ